jgi:hypothetical protein
MTNIEIDNCLISIDHLITYELNEQFEILTLLEKNPDGLIAPLLQFSLSRSKEKVKNLYSLRNEEDTKPYLWKKN